MNTARIAVLAIAIGAGGIAAYLASGSEKEAAHRSQPASKSRPWMSSSPKTISASARPSPPKTAVADLDRIDFERQLHSPEGPARGHQQIVGSIARAPFIAGEPIREQKLVKANGSGFMAAILPSGMRAVSTEISAETGAGGFILPNDRVDVILSKREKQVASSEPPPSTSSPPDRSEQCACSRHRSGAQGKRGTKCGAGQDGDAGNDADQSEILAKARMSGTLSLALRSIADSKTTALPPHR